jgi:CRP-like cAMP-binding protein
LLAEAKVTVRTLAQTTQEPAGAIPRALAMRLAHHLSLPAEEFERLPISAERSRNIARGEALYHEGYDCRHVFIVRQGWAIGSVALREGRRFIYRIYQAGDLVALEDMNWSYATTSVEAVTPLEVVLVDKVSLADMIVADAKLGGAILGLAMLDQVVAMDRARSNSRSDGPGRLAHLLLQAEARAAVTGSVSDGWFDFPLTQHLIADALGLTPIHINRSFKALLADGFVSRDKKTYRIERRQALNEMAEFIDRYDIVPQQLQTVRTTG